MNQTVYHVLLEGRTVGPYDRRTIVGLRIKKTLTNSHVLISAAGAQLTVADLLRQRQPFNTGRSSSLSLAQASLPASLLKVEGPGMAIPRFKGEIQVRVQGDALRLAGRFRRGLGWKEDRVKIALKDVVHARVQGSQVDLWLSNPGQARLQRVALELFAPAAAAEFVDWLPDATASPESEAGMAVAVTAAVPRPFSGTPAKGLWVALGGVILVVALMLMVVLLRRVY